MNKSMLLKAGLFSLICLPVLGQATTTTSSSVTPPTSPSQASQNPSPGAIPIIVHGAVVPSANQTTAPKTPAVNAPVTPTALTPATPTNPIAATAAAAAAAVEAMPTTPGQANTTTTTPAVTIPAPAAPANNATPPQSSTPPTTAPATPTLDCNYSIPPTSSAVDTALVLQWGQKAAQQTFTFTPSMVDTQLNVLKACFTEQGWQSFNDALTKSGNLDAIKKENLTVSNLLDGDASITATKNNQWKVIVPIQVIYQNDKEKIAQSLTINLTVGRKVSGDLGIMQIVAMPRQAATNSAPAATANPTATPAAPAAGAPTTTTPPATTQTTP